MSSQQKIEKTYIDNYKTHSHIDAGKHSKIFEDEHDISRIGGATEHSFHGGMVPIHAPDFDTSMIPGSKPEVQGDKNNNLNRSTLTSQRNSQFTATQNK